MPLGNTDTVSGGLYGGFTGGPAGGNFSINLTALSDSQRAEIGNLVEALTTGKATYDQKFSGDIGCAVSVNGERVFQSRKFSPIPDQFLQLQKLARSLDAVSRATNRQNPASGIGIN